MLLEVVVFLDAVRIRTGIALTRADAVLDAEFAIEDAINATANSVDKGPVDTGHQS